MEHEKTEGALKMVQKKNDWWRYQNERDEARRLQGAGKIRKDEEMTWEPPRKKPDWLVREEARSREESKWRLEPEGEAVVGEEEGAVISSPGNERKIALVWVNVRGGMRIFAAFFWHSVRWSPRNEAILEAVLKRARTTTQPWLIACDANMGPEDFEKKTFGFGKIKCM